MIRKLIRFAACHHPFCARSAQWDDSGDGQIDKKEFRGHVLALGVEAEPADIDALFRSLDKDGQGKLDVEEIKLAVKELYQLAEQDKLRVRRLSLDVVDAAKAMKASQAGLDRVLKADYTQSPVLDGAGARAPTRRLSKDQPGAAAVASTRRPSKENKLEVVPAIKRSGRNSK